MKIKELKKDKCNYGVYEHIPIGSSSEDIFQWLNKNKFEYSQIVNNVIHASKLKKIYFLFTIKCLYEFHISPSGILTAIDFKEGYIGL